tara:strand:- start:610 stop:2052 length:1443 start_codon:yes stop_codon:yes gene_type:complete
MQKNVLNHLILKAKDTMFGQKYLFNQINSYKDFKENVPLQTYEKIYPYIKKSRNGEENILWPGKVKWFARSSGTTNDISKYIPVTKDSLYECHFKAGKDMLSLYQNNFNTKNLYSGKGLMLGGTLSYSKNGASQEGDVSAILLTQFPFWVSYHRVPDIKTAILNDWEEKIDKIINQSINENITNITGVPSWMLIILQKILKKTGKKNILEVWPNLELYMHGGINFKPYQQIFSELIPSKEMNYLEGYNASEGFFGIQDSQEHKGLLLMVNHGVFFEFVLYESYLKGIKEAISLESVEIDKKYVIVISTNGGLWRYIIGDVVKFSSINPFRIEIIGRTQAYINAFGEELMVHNTDKALLKTCQQFQNKALNYTVAPVFLSEKSGKHQWLIEFEKAPYNLEEFTHQLDKNIQEINSDYTAKRSKDLILSKLEIISVKKGVFYNWLEKNNRLGGQYKIPKLSNDRRIIEEIITINNKFSTTSL